MDAKLALAAALSVAGVVLVLAAAFGPAATKVSPLPGLELQPFKTRRSRAAGVLVGAVILTLGLALGGLIPGPPGPTPAPASASPPASEAVASSAPPTAATPSLSLPPSPADSTPGVADWALMKRDELEALGIFIGPPQGRTLAADDGWFIQGFERAVAYQRPNGAVYAIVDVIYERWQRFLSPTKRPPALGFPTRDQNTDDPQHVWQRFESGAIQCTPVGCYVVSGAIHDAWRKYQSKLGYPKGEATTTLSTRTTRQAFDTGTVTLDLSGDVTVCGSDGSTIQGGGPAVCGPPLVAP